MILNISERGLLIETSSNLQSARLFWWKFLRRMPLRFAWSGRTIS